MRATRWLLALVLLGAGSNAYGFGMGTHAYVAWRVCGTCWPEAIYAAMAPDLFGLGCSPETKSQLQSMTHFEFERMAPSPFAIGFVTHNGVWGADHYTHCYYDSQAVDTYFTGIMRQLASEFGFSMNKSEDVVEAILDYMLRRDFGPWWGGFLASAADSCGSTQDEQLVEAFALPLSQRVPELALEGAQSELRLAASMYRTAMGVYGEQLAVHDLPYIRSILVRGMAMHLAIDDVTADRVMARAEELCVDYRGQLDAVAVSIHNKMQTTKYAVPLCGALPLTLTLGVVACAILRQRRRL